MIWLGTEAGLTGLQFSGSSFLSFLKLEVQDHLRKMVKSVSPHCRYMALRRRVLIPVLQNKFNNNNSQKKRRHQQLRNTDTKLKQLMG